MKWAIVLAAGRATRMGTQKALLPLGGTTVIGRIVDRLAATALDGIAVVVGHEGRRVAEALRDRAVKVVENPDPGRGMLSSVRCGLEALPEGCRAALVALGDQPGIRPEVVDAMLRAFDGGRKGIVVPVHGGRQGHPILFDLRYRDEVLERHDEEGLRGLLAAHREDVLGLEVEDPGILADMDTPEDYRRELRTEIHHGTEDTEDGRAKYGRRDG
jgi:molybdenum cofactor cytidylyltransferase